MWPKSESVKKCRFCYAKIQGDPNAVNVDANGTPGSSVGVKGTLRPTTSKFPNEEEKGKH